MEEVTGPQLRHERLLANLTQAEVAARMGVRQPVVSQNEQKARVHPGWAQRFRDALARESATEKAPDAA